MKTITYTLATLLTLVFGVSMLSGCENAKYTECKNNASKLWDDTQGGNPHKNDAYWAAIKECNKYK